jgi:hypothetical protein
MFVDCLLLIAFFPYSATPLSPALFPLVEKEQTMHYTSFPLTIEWREGKG